MNNYISVIVPVYNVEKYLQKLFSCLVSQQYEFFEVIFVNDCSTDNSLHLVQSFCCTNSEKYVCISNPTNYGLNPSRKIGLDKAKYDLIAFLDSDDYIEDDYLTNLVSHITNDIDIVCEPVLTEDEDGNFISALNESKKGVEIWDNYEALLKLFRGYEVGNFMHSKLFKKQVLHNIDFTYRLPFEDYTTTHIAFYNAHKICKIDKGSYHYVKRRNTLSSKTKKSYLSCIDAMLLRRKWVVDNIFNNTYMNAIDDSLFDRFIQIVSSYYIGKKNEYYTLIYKLYNENASSRKLITYTTRNLSFYFKTPLLYMFAKKIISFIRLFKKHEL